MNNLTNAEKMILDTSIKDLMQYNLFKKYYFDFACIGFQTKASAREFLSEQKRLIKASLV